MALRKLAVANFFARKTRVSLTVAAIALSVSLVVSVTSGYASVEAAAAKYLERFMGTSDAMITHKSDPHTIIAQTLVDELRADPAVKRVTGRLELESVLVDVKGIPIIGRPAQIIGIDRPGDTRVENLQINSGAWFNSADTNEAVIDEVASEKLNVRVGDSFKLPGARGPITLKVTGIVQKPKILAAAIQSVYMPLHTLQKFSSPDKPAGVNRVMLDLKSPTMIDDFVARWNPKLEAIDPDLKMRLAREGRGELDKNLQGLHVLSYLGGTVSMLSATFIVFSTLSMGVSERSRTLAMLRAIGAVRSQVAGLVVIEGILLASAGVVIGLPLGWSWVFLLKLKFPFIFTAGVVLSRGGLLLGAGGSLLAAIVASLLPAWSATRVSPLEAMSPQSEQSSMRLPIICAFVGLLLASIDPLIMYGPWDRWIFSHSADPMQSTRLMRFYGHFGVGLPMLMFGFFLLSPVFVWVLERVAGPIVSYVLGIKSTILRQQLSSGIWRAAGTCAALMVGLAILVVMEVQGNSMIRGWVLPDKFPDMFIVSWLSPLNEAQVDKLRQVRGIQHDQVMPIAIASPEFGGASLFSLGQAAMMPDATMFFGIDPELGMKMMELEFKQGNKTDAVRMLKEGRHIIVTEEFYQLKHLTVGDKLSLKTAKHGSVDFTIAGVVWSPGIDVIVSMFDMGRQFDQRTAASIFGSLDDAKEEFGVDGYRLFAANMDYFTDKDVVLKDVEKQVGVMGMSAGDVRQIKAGIQSAFQNLLLLISTVPLAAMTVASLGVANAIMASIRTRRWQFGVLRSIGLTRSQLLRVVLSESMLIGIVGCGLGLVLGGVMEVDSRELSRLLVGYNPPVYLPWGKIIFGGGFVIVVSIVASLWPAIRVARTQPLDLLQAGRASE